MSVGDWIALGMGLFLLGVFLMFLAFFLEATRRGEGDGGERAEAGGVVIIGPVPIVFGSSQRIAKAVLILAIALTVLVLALYLLLYWY
ncbi:MAG: TIGR00304 family membrane protein [Thermoproteus sp.]|jgi:uncharacterized protein (TIGR00304 family)